MKIIDRNLLQKLSQQAKLTVRKRKNQNFHQSYDDPMNRMLNALQPESYVHPHKHENPDKTEVFIILTGKIAVIEFDNDGRITETVILSQESGNFIAEISPGVWHTVVTLEETVYYEIKNGPYDVNNDKQFAEWAPSENSELASEYLNSLKGTIKSLHPNKI